MKERIKLIKQAIKNKTLKVIEYSTKTTVSAEGVLIGESTNTLDAIAWAGNGVPEVCEWVLDWAIWEKGE